MIFTPFQLPRLTLKNRLVVAPMTTYSSLPDGQIHPDELDYLHRRAAAGYGMVMTAACYVHKSGHAFEGQWSCADDSTLTSLHAAAEAIRSGGAAACLQIHHGGRRAPSRLCGRPLSASAIPSEIAGAETPFAMTEVEIEEMIAAFGQAARRAREAGFDAVEIHGANTYLLQQFVSPHSNRREDRWGMDRLLFSTEVVDRVRAAVGPSFPVGYRFSPEENETPGIRLSDTFDLIERLAERGLDWLHISLRDYRQGSFHDGDEPLLKRVSLAIGGRVPFIGVGSVRLTSDAEACLTGGADLVAIGRAAISEPEWPHCALAEQPPRLTIDASLGRNELTLPEGLWNKILAVEGWFEVENRPEPATR